MPRITVITPITAAGATAVQWNRTLRSIAGQTGIEWEHLLVGQCCPPTVEEHVGKMNGAARWIPSPATSACELVNVGLQQSAGEIVAWLNPGDVYYRDTLRVVAESFDEAPAAGVVFGDAVLFDEDEHPRGRFRTKYWQPSRIQTRCCLCQPAAFVRRDVFQQAGGLDAGLLHWGDYDLWLRLQDRGIAFHRTPQLLSGCEVPMASGTMHLGPFARDISLAATAELNDLYKRRRGHVPARWLVHAGRVATTHDPHVRAESIPYFLSSLRHARAEAARHGQSAWTAPVAWAWLPFEAIKSEWKRLRRDPHPVKRLVPVERVAAQAKSSLAVKRERLAAKRRQLATRVADSAVGRAYQRVVDKAYAGLDAVYRVVDYGASTVDRLSRPARDWLAHCVAQSKRRIFKLKNYDARPLKFPGAYSRTRVPQSAARISIVTPNLNQGPFLEATIRSVVDQGYPNVEYIVQDGLSKDESLDVLRRFDSQIAHWASEKDSGQANAINRGMRHATGEIMAYLNSDDILLPGSLAYVANFFAEHPEVDVVYGHRVLIDENGADIGRWVLPPHDDHVLAFVDYVPQETMFWRRSIWDKVGGQLDEAFHFAMDWDLILRFREHGAKFHRLPRFLGAFRISSDNKTTKLLETVGRRDMEILRKRVLGRIPDDQEIHDVIRPYLKRHWIFDKLYIAGVLRY